MDCVLLQGSAVASSSLEFKQAFNRAEDLHFGPRSSHFRLKSLASHENRRIHVQRPRRSSILCAPNTNQLETESAILSPQETTLKIKGKEVAKDLRGTGVFLIGMMGSGKSTVGKIVSDALGYYFFDSDKLVEQAAGGASVAQIFKEQNEEGFRDAETEVLQQLSGMLRVVVATGGGAVVRPQNWGYLRHGITVYLDVPLDALAKRVVAAGPEKRPLLGQHSKEVAHEQALARLTKLYEERGRAYANADVTVSIQKVAGELGVENVNELTPSTIALKVLEQTQDLIRSQKHYGKPRIGLL